MPATTLNARNLERLGAAALAELLVEVAAGHGAIKRRLRLALADAAGADEIGVQVRKRLATISRARSRLDWRQLRALAADLSTQAAAIAGPLARADPRAAHDLMWTFLALAAPLADRAEDGAGRLAAVFDAARADLPRLAATAGIAPAALADRLFDALTTPDRGGSPALVAALADPLGTDGLDRLRDRVAAWAAAAPATGDRAAALRRAEVARSLLESIADARGDPDAWIAQQPERSRTTPAVAVAIARRLVDAGRAEAALAALVAVDPARMRFAPPDCDTVRLAALDALGRHDDAQAHRWHRFAAALDAGQLRDHLRRLPDFDDFAAEQRALALVEGHGDVHAALAFLLAWPAPERAARLAITRGDAFDGERYEVLGPAADALDAAHPLAATVLRRAMIGFALRTARSSRYGHAARHLAACADADPRIADHAGLPDHASYIAALRRDWSHRRGFWQMA